MGVLCLIRSTPWDRAAATQGDTSKDMGRMSFLQYLWKGRRNSPGSGITPERPPRHPDPAPHGGTRGSPQPPHTRLVLQMKEQL